MVEKNPETIIKFTARGALTIPRYIYEAAGVQPGDYVVVEVRGKRIIITPAVVQKIID